MFREMILGIVSLSLLVPVMLLADEPAKPKFNTRSIIRKGIASTAI
jgi:hypothetical protein